MTSHSVLLVDDDPVFSRLTRSLLEENGMEVAAAFSKAEGLDVFERERPSCVLLDIGLPDGSGLELIKPIRAVAPATPIIMVSSQGEIRDVVNAMKEGANDYLKKPFRGDELLLKIQMVVEATNALSELSQLRNKAHHEDEYHLLFGMSGRLGKVQAIVDQVANTDITVLITGESGTGKELVAKALHKRSDRADQPFIKVNCAALPRELLESELFGFERGAFTGAHRRKSGRFEMAQNGTIFLDEISEMHPDLQSKLLHVLQEKQYFRIGGEKEVRVNSRVLVATNKDMAAMVDEGRFRRDLYYRINVVNIVIPPLRERKEDIAVLVDFFLGRYSEMYNRERTAISSALMEKFLQYSWPGNVRELENNIKRFVILGNEGQLVAEMSRKRESAPPPLRPAVPAREEPPEEPRGAEPLRRRPARELDGGDHNGAAVAVTAGRSTLKEVAKQAQRVAERELIGTILAQTRWNRRKAAKILNISYKALLYKIKECGLNEE